MAQHQLVHPRAVRGYLNRFSIISALVLVVSDPFKINLKESFKDFSNQTTEFNVKYKTRDIYFIGSTNAWKKINDMNLWIKTQIKLRKSRILFNRGESFFFQVCSNPAYYEKLQKYGLVSRETIDRASEITKNMNAFSYAEQADKILKVCENSIYFIICRSI
jgi:hypothetical protein